MLTSKERQKIFMQQKLVKKIIFLINIFIYLVFIGLVLVFQYVSRQKPPPCGGRVSEDQSNSSIQVNKKLFFNKDFFQQGFT